MLRDVRAEYNTNSDNLRLAKAIICAGLYPNIIRVEKPASFAGSDRNDKNDRNKAMLKYYTKKNEEVAIHPSSTLFGLPALPSEQEKWLIYHEKVKTSKVYIRDGTFIAPYPLLLFGGQIDVHHEKQMIELDKWILFRANAKVRAHRLRVVTLAVRLRQCLCSCDGAGGSVDAEAAARARQAPVVEDREPAR
jgi:hypothetical protein